MVPSSSEDVTRAMRGQPKRLSRNYVRRNGGFCKSHFMCSDFQRRFTAQMFSALSAVFLCACLAVNSLEVHSFLGSLIGKLQRQRQRQRVQWLCTRPLHFFVHFFAILHKTTTWNDQIMRIRENVNYNGHTFSNFDAALPYPDRTSLTVGDKLY